MKLANKFPEKYNVELFKHSEREHRYTVRRRVIDVLYEVNRELQSLGFERLPRIDVRVVKKADYAGMAYIGRNIIHITEKATDYNSLNFRFVVWHEIVHGLGWGHVEGCYLMDANPWRIWSNVGDVETTVWSKFLEYVAEFQSK